MLEGGLHQGSGLDRGPRVPALIAVPLDAPHPALWAAHLALGLQMLGRRTVVLDASAGILARSFGHGPAPERELLDVLQGACGFGDAAIQPQRGLWVMGAERAIDSVVAAGVPPGRMLEAFGRLAQRLDDVLLAMPVDEIASMAPPPAVPIVGIAGGHQGRLQAYDVVKRLTRRFNYPRLACVVHGVPSRDEALRACETLERVAAEFASEDAQVGLAGWLPGSPDAAALRRTAHGVLDAIRCELAAAA